MIAKNSLKLKVTNYINDFTIMNEKPKPYKSLSMPIKKFYQIKIFSLNSRMIKHSKLKLRLVFELIVHLLFFLKVKLNI